MDAQRKCLRENDKDDDEEEEEEDDVNQLTRLTQNIHSNLDCRREGADDARCGGPHTHGKNAVNAVP